MTCLSRLPTIVCLLVTATSASADGNVRVNKSRYLSTDIFAWSDYASTNENAECDETSLVGGVGCRGHYCDDARLACLTNGGVVSGLTSYWTSPVSEETAPMVCIDNHFVTAISCQGHYCDNIALKCTSSEDRTAGANCAWTAWVSEEGTGTLMFNDDMYARGIECRGSYCDNKRFYVCPAVDVRLSSPTVAPSVAPVQTLSPTTLSADYYLGLTDVELYSFECLSSPNPKQIGDKCCIERRQSSVCHTSIIAGIYTDYCTGNTSGLPWQTHIANIFRRAIREGQCGLDSTASPTVAPIPTPYCQSTSGQCASTSNELQNMLTAANAQDVVTICDGTTITSSAVISNTVPNLTLCCDGTDCAIENDGTSATFVSTGTSFTVKDIAFSNGSAHSSDGGNLSIQGFGNHKVLGCTFSGGQSDQAGGNVSVKSVSSVTVTNSTFSNGSAQSGSGGLHVRNTARMTVEQCTFSENHGSRGGALSMYLTTGYEFRVEDSDFDSNTADLGAAALYAGVSTAIGNLASLEVLNSTFTDNVVASAPSTTWDGGAGWFGSCEGQKSVDYTFAGNSGSGNSHVNTCDGFFFLPPGCQKFCLAVDQDVTL